MRMMKFPNVQNAVTSTSNQISTAINSLEGHNIVNSKYIAIQIYMRVDTPGGTLLLKYATHRTLEQLHSWWHFLYS